MDSFALRKINAAHMKNELTKDDLIVRLLPHESINSAPNILLNNQGKPLFPGCIKQPLFKSENLPYSIFSIYDLLNTLLTAQIILKDETEAGILDLIYESSLRIKLGYSNQFTNIQNSSDTSDIPVNTTIPDTKLLILSYGENDTTPIDKRIKIFAACGIGKIAEFISTSSRKKRIYHYYPTWTSTSEYDPLILALSDTLADTYLYNLVIDSFLAIKTALKFINDNDSQKKYQELTYIITQQVEEVQAKQRKLNASSGGSKRAENLYGQQKTHVIKRYVEIKASKPKISKRQAAKKITIELEKTPELIGALVQDSLEDTVYRWLLRHKNTTSTK